MLPMATSFPQTNSSVVNNSSQCFSYYCLRITCIRITQDVCKEENSWACSSRSPTPESQQCCLYINSLQKRSKCFLTLRTTGMNYVFLGSLSVFGNSLVTHLMPGFPVWNTVPFVFQVYANI